MPRAASDQVNYSIILRFASCQVAVRARGKRVEISAGATMSAEEALSLMEAILAARRVAIGQKVETR